jgi:hypothetical protein
LYAGVADSHARPAEPGQAAAEIARLRAEHAHLRRYASANDDTCLVLEERVVALEAALRKIREESRNWGWDFSPDEIEEIIASVALGEPAALSKDDAGDPGA